MKNDQQVYLIGNAHIDPVWLWRWQEGYAEIKATFRSALDRMKEFPDFVFTSACADYYEWIEENDPLMFAEIRQRVKEGRWVIVGGWWIQPDCNLPSGESFVRHGLYSQQYFFEKFGVTAKTGYNVDSFGHNGMLPQILKKSGMDYYVFQRPCEAENGKIPGPLFWWESPDGSRVLAFRIDSYGDSPGADGAERKRQNVLQHVSLAKEKGYPVMCFYGVGNHGGGPTISLLNMLEKMKWGVDGDQLAFSSPNDYFKKAALFSGKLPVWKNELQHHASGCYSTMSELKRYNRKAESLLLAAEKFAVITSLCTGLDYPGEKLKNGWKDVMFNQFHDVMGGCCIKDAAADAKAFYGEAVAIGSRALNAAVQKISWAVDTMGEKPKHVNKDQDFYLWEEENCGAPVIVFNPLSWEAEVPVCVNRLLCGVTDQNGDSVSSQKVRGQQTNMSDKWNTLFMAKVPALGYRLYWMYLSKKQEPAETQADLKCGESSIENEFMRLEIDKHTGYIKRLFDKKRGKDVLSGDGAVPLVVDINHCDTWAHNYFEFRDVIAKFCDAEIKVTENGPVRAAIRVSSRYGRSVLTQYFMLYAHRPGVEVRVRLDWREQHKLLKLSFQVNAEKPESVYEIPYGFIKRQANGEENPGQKWISIEGEDGGLSLLNDCKYSFDIKENEMRMTIANGSIYADHYADYYGENRDDECEFMDQGIQEFRYFLLPHSKGWERPQTVKRAYELNTEFPHVMETYHAGPLPKVKENIKISAPNIIAAVLKQSENGQELILRFYETQGIPADTEIELLLLHKSFHAHFTPCEIKTFYVPLQDHGEIHEVDMTELKLFNG